MGIVVLRSTTPWVAESSLSNSDLLTVISIVAVPAADAIASTGIRTEDLSLCVGGALARYFYYFPYIKSKTIKTSSNRREEGKVEDSSNSNHSIKSSHYLRVQDQARLPRPPLYNLDDPEIPSQLFHSVHSLLTDRLS